MTGVRVAPRAGRHVLLRPVVVDDYPTLQRAESDPRLLQQWRFRGATPSPEQWNAVFWGGVLAQFLVIARSSEKPVALVVAYGPNYHDGYAYVGATKLSMNESSPLAALGFFLFLEHVFWTWPFRKLYLEVPGYNLAQFRSSLGRLFSEEGRLKDHLYFGGRYWDQYLLALYRDTWNLEAPRLLAAERIADWKGEGSDG